MKIIHILSLLTATLIFSACASNGGSETAKEEAAPTGSESGSYDAKTAYDGSTGTGLLMERYKAGSIEGFRD